MEMKRRLIILSVAIMAFLAIPLRANAAYKGTSGKMGEYGVSGFVEIDDSSAHAYTNCQYSPSYCSVSVTYYYVDETDGILKSNSASSAGLSNVVNAYAGRNPDDKDHVCRSFRATSTHSVTFGSYTWNFALSVDY